jgi:hypothetical protein
MSQFELENSMIFRSSPQAIAERRQVLEGLRWGSVASLLLLAWLIWGSPLWLEILVWLLALALIASLARLSIEPLLEPYASRELRLQENAMELVEGNFTRLLFFEHLESLRMIQGKGEKVLALEIKGMDSSLVLRGYENMELLFAQISERRPQQVLLEVVEAKFNTESLGALAALVVAAALLILLLLLCLSFSSKGLADLGGILLILLGASSAYFQPLAPHPMKGDWRNWSAAGALLILGLLLML